MAKYNDKTVDEICKYLEDGMPQKDAARLSGIDESTFYDWMKDKPSFPSRVEASLSKYKEKLVNIINVNSVKDGKLALEILARRFPEEFSSTQKVEMVNPQVELDRIKKLIDKKHDKGTDEKRLVSGHSSDTLQEQE